jgi:hypothetical protein
MFCVIQREGVGKRCRKKEQPNSRANQTTREQIVHTHTHTHTHTLVSADIAYQTKLCTSIFDRSCLF